MLEQINKENFNQMLGQFSTTELEGMVEKFPYFQQAHLLLAKKYQQENSPKFDQQLQLAALYVQDRELLYTLFNDKNKPTIPVSEIITSAKPEVSQSINDTIEMIEISTPEVTGVTAPPVIDAVEEIEVPKQEQTVDEANLKSILEEIEKTSKELSSYREPVFEEKQAEIIEVKQPEVPETIVEIVLEPVNEAPVEPTEEANGLKALLQEIEKTAKELNTYNGPVVEEKRELGIEVNEPEIKEEQSSVETEANKEEIAKPVEEENQLKLQEQEEEEPAIEENSLIEENPVQAFSRIEPHTFDEWLKAFNNKSAPEKKETPVTEKEAAPAEKDELSELIAVNASVDYLHELVKEETTYAKGLERFIEEQVQKHKQQEVKKAAPENDHHTEAATETMAKVYEMQNKYARAIKTYEALILKFPEKRDLFTLRINYLKPLL